MHNIFHPIARPTSRRRRVTAFAFAAALLCLIAHSPTSLAQSGPQGLSQSIPWQFQNPLSQSNASRFPQIGAFGLWFVSERQGWAVGRQGNVLSTSDGGATWTPQKSASQRELNAVRFVNETTGCATGYDGIMTTQDAGRTWSLLAQTSDFSGNALWFVNERVGWAVGSSGAVRVTQDGGRTWTRQGRTATANISVNELYEVAFSDEQTGVIAGVDGLFTTTNGGAAWTLQVPRSSPLLGGGSALSVWFSAPLRGWATGVDSTLLATTDGGRTWTARKLPVPSRTSNDLKLVRFANATAGWVLADNGTLFRTTDGGVTWDAVFTFPLFAPADLRFSDERNGWACMNNGDFEIIFRTSDGGRTWSQQRASALVPMMSVTLPTPSEVAITSWPLQNTFLPPVVLQSTNSTTFTIDSTNAPAASVLLGSAVASDSALWAVGSQATVFRKARGGASWVRRTNGFFTADDVLTSIAAAGNSMVVVGRGTVTGAGAGPLVRVTANSGQSWTSVLPLGSGNATLNDVAFATNRIGWAVGTGGMIITTFDGGQTWARQTSGTTAELRSVFFVDVNTGWAVGGGTENAIILKTTNGGDSWQRQAAPADSQLRGVWFSDAQTGWAVGAGGMILGTVNGGESWRIQQSGTKANLNGVAFASKARGWVVGDSGVVLRTLNAGYAPTLSVNYPAAPRTLNFGVLPVGQSTTQTISLSAQYLLQPLTISVPENFSVSDGTQGTQTPLQRSITLVPGEDAATSATVTVRFAPTRDGIIAGALTFSSVGITSSALLGGFGLNRPTIVVAPSALQFPLTKLGSSTTATLWVKNVGSTSGTIAVGIAARQQDFGVVNTQATQNVVLRAGDSTQVTVRFAPPTVLTSFGAVASTLVVRVTSSVGDSTVFVPLSGVGGFPIVNFQPRLLNMGSLAITATTRASIGLVNTGNIATRIYALALASSTNAAGGLPTSGFSITSRLRNAQDSTVDVEETEEIQITFRPRLLGFARDTLFALTDAGLAGAMIIANAEPLLAAPNLTAPPDERIDLPIAPQFQWDAVSDAATYDFQVVRDSTMFDTRPEASVTGLRARDAKGYVLDSNLAYSTTYFWRVRAKNERTESPWSRVFSFRTQRTNPSTRVAVDTSFTALIGQSERLSFTITNITSSPVTLGKPLFRRNDDAVFSVRDDQFPQTLRSRGGATILFNFTPRDEKRYQAIMLIPVAGSPPGGTATIPIDTAEIQMFGTGLAAGTNVITTKILVRTNRNDARPGDTLLIQIVLDSSQNLNLKRNRDFTVAFDAVLRVRNPSVLAVLNDTPVSPKGLSSDNLLFSGNTIQLQNIPRDTTLRRGVLAELAAIALQGSAGSTPIEFISFDWKGTATSGIAQATIRNVVDSAFVVQVCKDGGERFITRAKAGGLQRLAPNPTSDDLVVRFVVDNPGHVELYATDVLGRRVTTLAASTMEVGEYEAHLPARTWSEGVYTLVLTTSSGVWHQQVRVVK